MWRNGIWGWAKPPKMKKSVTCIQCQCNALRLMTWTNNFSKTFLIFASLIPFFRLIIPEKCFYQWILCHNFVYMKKFPWFLSFELGARQACDRRHRTMGTVHSGKISHLTWTFTKKYWAVLGCTGLYWAVLGHLRYLLGNVQVKWRILPLCTAAPSWLICSPQLERLHLEMRLLQIEGTCYLVGLDCLTLPK